MKENKDVKLLIKRVSAQILDTLIYFGILVLINFVLIVLFSVASGGNRFEAGGIIQGIVFVAVFVLIHSKQLAHSGATFGYRLVKLKIVNKNGEKLSQGQAISRAVLRLVYYAFSFSAVLVIYHFLGTAYSYGESDPIDQLMGTKVVSST